MATDGAVPDLQGLPDGLIGHVGDVQDDPGLAQGPVQSRGGRLESPLGAGAVDIGVVAEVGGTHHAQSGVPPELHVVGVGDGVRALHGKDVVEGRVRVRILPRLNGLFQIVPTVHRLEVALAGHGLVVGQVAPSHADALFLGPQPVLHASRSSLDPGHDRAEDDSDATFAEFGKGGSAGPAGVTGSDLGRFPPFLLPDLFCRQSQVPIPVERVPGQVQMQVDDQWFAHGARIAGSRQGKQGGWCSV